MTRPQPESSTQEVLAGVVERVTFHNAENGFCVLRIKARGHRELVTVVGHAAVISAGEWITASGEWVNDHTHGQQFKARFMRTSAPTSINGIEKYLSSGMIRGIGPVYARKMIKAFGEKVFDIIEAEPDRLREVDGIGPIRAKRITDAWAEQKIVREIMFGGLEAHAPKIFGYDAKWTPDSAAYIGTLRRFGLEQEEPELAKTLKKLALACWTLFGFKGYARVDFRVDPTGKPFIIDVNPNPYLTPDTEDAAAAAEAGLSYQDLIGRIVESSLGISQVMQPVTLRKIA